MQFLIRFLWCQLHYNYKPKMIIFTSSSFENQLCVCGFDHRWLYWFNPHAQDCEFDSYRGGMGLSEASYSSLEILHFHSFFPLQKEFKPSSGDHRLRKLLDHHNHWSAYQLTYDQDVGQAEWYRQLLWTEWTGDRILLLFSNFSI